MTNIHLITSERRRLDTLIDQFRLHAPAICAEAHDPLLAQDMCEYWSGIFIDWLAAQGVEGEAIVYEGSRVAFPRHSWEGIVDFSDHWHIVVAVEGHHVDWSHRQFDTDAAIPHITPDRQGHIDWKIVMPYVDYIAIEERYGELQAEAA